MNTKNRLNCFVFSNLIAGFLSMNFLVQINDPVRNLKEIARHDGSDLVKIYETEAAENLPTIASALSQTIDVNANNSGNQGEVISVSKKAVQSEKTVSYVKPSYNSVTGTNLVNYAKHYLGLRYVSGGNSLSTGTDCSGFTRLIYKEFGINLGRTVSSQVYSGTYVSRGDLQPGDLVFYSYTNRASHVAIYIGNGMIIHESNPRDGVKISTVNIMNYITARRLITANVNSQSQQTTEQVKDESVKIETSKVEIKEEKKEEEVKIEEKKEEAIKVEEKKEEVVKVEEKKEEVVVKNEIQPEKKQEEQVEKSTADNNVSDTTTEQDKAKEDTSNSSSGIVSDSVKSLKKQAVKVEEKIEVKTDEIKSTEATKEITLEEEKTDN